MVVLNNRDRSERGLFLYQCFSNFPRQKSHCKHCEHLDSQMAWSGFFFFFLERKGREKENKWLRCHDHVFTRCLIGNLEMSSQETFEQLSFGVTPFGEMGTNAYSFQMRQRCRLKKQSCSSSIWWTRVLVQATVANIGEEILPAGETQRQLQHQKSTSLGETSAKLRCHLWSSLHVLQACQQVESLFQAAHQLRTSFLRQLFTASITLRMDHVIPVRFSFPALVGLLVVVVVVVGSPGGLSNWEKIATQPHRHYRNY